jgi:hypothetical protein
VGVLTLWTVDAMDPGASIAAWLHAWDASRWLVAFAVIECDVFGWAGSAKRMHG